MWALVLDAMNNKYINSWSCVYTDGSLIEKVCCTGAGIWSAFFLLLYTLKGKASLNVNLWGMSGVIWDWNRSF